MDKVLDQIANNRVFGVTILAWIIAQGMKVLLGIVKEKRFNFRWFVGTGGMPSAHSAGAAALASSSGMSSGFDSVIFAVTLIFALVTMFDAQGVRRATGKQAEILNLIADDLYKGDQIKPDRLMELVGHTPLQVVVGALIGIFVAVIFYR